MGPRRGAGDGEDPGRSGAASSRACCSRATRSATCWPPLVYLLLHDGFGLGWRWLFAFSHPAGADHPVHPHPGQGVGGLGDRQAAQELHPDHGGDRCSPTRRSSAGSSTWSLLMTAFNWMSHGTQDIYPTFLKATHGGAGLGASTATWYRGHLQHRRDHRRHRRRGAVGAVRAAPDRSSSARVLGLPIVPIFAYSPHGRDAGLGLVPDAVDGAGRLGRDPGPPHRAAARTRSAASTRA